MPLLYQQNINEQVKMALWRISEPEAFFQKSGFQANHINHPEKRVQHLAGRFLLKMMLPELAPDSIVVPENRKPYLSTDADMDFSISHANDMVGVIIGKKHKVGMDIEWQGIKVLAVKHKFMNEDDERSFDADEFSEMEKATICWTIKESAFKMMDKRGVDFKRDFVLKKVMKENEGWVATLCNPGFHESELLAKGMVVDRFQICMMANKI